MRRSKGHYKHHGCNWCVVVEESTEGWMIYIIHPHHVNAEGKTHGLFGSLAKAKVSSSWRAGNPMPEELEKLGWTLKTAGMKPKDVLMAIESEAGTQGIDITWNYNGEWHCCHPA